jgi:TPR repeat protein
MRAAAVLWIAVGALDCATSRQRECSDGESCHALALKAEQDDRGAADRLLDRACRMRHLESCYDLAVHEVERGSVAAAVTHYDGACSAGFVAACYNLGTCLVSGECSHDPRRGAQLLKRACDGGEPRGCLNLGNSYLVGRGVEANPPEGVRLLGKACDAGVALACGNLGFMFERGEFVARDQDRARALLRRACEGGVADACAP